MSDILRDTQQTRARMSRAPNRGTRRPEMPGTVAIRWICVEMVVYYRKSSLFGSRVFVERVSPRVVGEAKNPGGGVVWYSKSLQIDIDGCAKCTSSASYSQIS